MTATVANARHLIVESAKANLPAKGKDEDSVFVCGLPEPGGLLLGVADGISTANGRTAARWIAQIMGELAGEPEAVGWDARSLFGLFSTRLADAAAASSLADSHSTLSCGIARIVRSHGTPFLRFEFFGIGDSPIWRVVRPATESLEFQVNIAYGAPVPSELSGLYSWVNLGQGRVEGRVHFGSVDVESGELLIVATDGIPESRVLIDDQDQDLRPASPRMIKCLLDAERIDDIMLGDLLREYDQAGLLIDDDASMVVLRLAPSPFAESGQTTSFDPESQDGATPALLASIRARGRANRTQLARTLRRTRSAQAAARRKRRKELSARAKQRRKAAAAKRKPTPGK